MSTQEISFANGITLAITHSMKDQTVVYNAVGYITGEPSNVVATFGYDLSREELIKVIFNISGPDALFELLVPYIEPYEDEKEYEVGVEYDGTEEVAATRKWLAELEKVRNFKIANPDLEEEDGYSNEFLGAAGSTNYSFGKQ